MPRLSHSTDGKSLVYRFEELGNSLQSRPSHSSIGPGIPDPPAGLPVTLQEHRHRIPDYLKVVGHPVLGGLHHEYELVTKAA